MKNNFVNPVSIASACAITVLAVVLMVKFEAPQWSFWIVLSPAIAFLIVFLHFHNLKNWRELTERRTILILQSISWVLYVKSIGSLTVSALSFAGYLKSRDQNGQYEIAYKLLQGYSPYIDIFLIVLASILLIFTLRHINTNKKGTIPIKHIGEETSSPIINVNVPEDKLESASIIDIDPNSENTNDLSTPTPLSLLLSEVEPLSKSDITEAVDYHSYDSDKPPTSEVWVGRSSELELVNQINSGTIVVTGMGGQGKSLFTAKVLENWLKSNSSGFYDWRDCREYSERFRVQLTSIIERLTCGQVIGDALTRVSDIDLIRYFFRITRGHHGLIVFDNVDHYVNVETQEFHGTVDTFIKEALHTQSNLLVIFTCRPSVSYPDVNFREIPLKGLTYKESVDLFRGMSISEKIANNKKIEEIHQLTKGHPFWLTIISAHLSRKPESIDTLIADLKVGNTEDQRTASRLRPIWKGLNERQQIILRTMSESTKAEDEEALWNIVSPMISSHNQFQRALRALRSMSLVIDKGSESHGRTYELHPIVRQFVKSEFPTSERVPFMNLLTKAFEKYVLILTQHSQQSIIISARPFEYTTLSIDIELEANNYLAAATKANNVRDAYLARGLGEEFLRISDHIMEAIDWNNDSLSEEEIFHKFTWGVLRTLGDYGKEENGNQLIENYERFVPRGTANYIGWCTAMCDFKWTLGKYDEAIHWGEEGNQLKLESDIDTVFDTLHSLNLSKRDSGKAQEALAYFSRNRDLDEILSADHKSEDFNAPFFGNIGRCVHLLGDYESALKFYVRSADLLSTEKDAISVMNKGWASLWIGLVCIDLKDWENAKLFLSKSRDIWRERAPFKLQLVYDEVKSMPEGYALHPLEEKSETDSKCSILLREWLKKK